MRQELRHPAFRRVSISRKHRFCYFRVPKAANSTIIQTLQANMRAEESESVARFPKHALHGVPDPKEMAGLFVFTVVRNPVTRLLSAYLEKAPQEKYRKKYGFYHRDNRKLFSFEDFLQRLQDGLLYSDIHWAPQTSILPYDLKKYSHIGKFELLNDELDFITSEIFSKPCKIHNVDSHKTNSKDFLSKITNRELRIVRDMFEKDFIELNYDI
ncbi:MAG: sulfotransferase family 2 domain-containing protein [Anderseniella sp.]